MIDPPVVDPIEYSVYGARDGAEMTRLLGEVFSRGDPPNVAVGLTATEFEGLVQQFCPKAATERLTIVARQAGTGELVGALLAEDSASPPPGGMDRLSPKFGPIFDLLAQLNREYWGDRVVPLGESLHLFLLGVAESVSGRGVAQRLVTKCLEHGTQEGYRMAVTEATNRASQHVFRKLGFVERAQCLYSEHRFAGRAPFASIAHVGGPILMDRSLVPR
jgi:GNAT superfamily N-acetyltransferase